MDKFDVVTFGETMVLFNPDSKGPIRHIHNFTKSIAGAESNVAIALSKLGHKVGWFSNLGDDEFGRYIEFVIRGEGVDVSRIKTDNLHRTGIMFKETFGHTDSNVYYYREGSAASYISEHDIDDDYIINSKILHITGITPALSETAKKALYKAIAVAKVNQVLVSFDPNIRLKLWSAEEAKKVLLDIARYADIIFPGIDEAKLLLGTTNIDTVINEFHALGAKIVVLKMGKDGCIVSEGGEVKEISGFMVDTVVDSVGAGDGFAAGFLSGHLSGLTISESAIYANAIGAMATQVKGDIEGFPTKEQLLGYINKENHIGR